jgi:hypothetical protein
MMYDHDVLEPDHRVHGDEVEQRRRRTAAHILKRERLEGTVG